MARFARIRAPGCVFHVISRFLNREYCLRSEDDRAYYLRGVPNALARSDWRPLAYALMSSHVHWVLLAGDAPLSRFINPLHTRFAMWCNRKYQRLGPVFAARPTSILVESELPRLLAYVHNNPVRAGLVEEPASSTWTSHLAYIGKAAAPPWLDVRAGFRMANISGDASPGAFHQMVLAHAKEPRDALLTGGDLVEIRRRARTEAGSAIEISSPRLVTPQSAVVELRTTATCSVPSNVRIELDVVLDAVAKSLDVSPTDLRKGSRRAPLVFARRLFLHAAMDMGAAVGMASAELGLSISGGLWLLRPGKNDQRLREALRNVRERIERSTGIDQGNGASIKDS